MVKKCRSGRPCGNSCISLDKVCRVDSSDTADRVANTLTGLVSSAQPTFTNNNILAQGNFGKVTLSDDGKVVKKELLTERDGNQWGTLEIELGVKMGEAGHSPKVYSHLTNDSQIVMDVAPGKPLWASFRQDKETEPTSMSEPAGRKTLGAILYMHQNLKAYHGDLHSQQMIIDGDDVQLIDFGLSGRIEGDDGWAKATTDIRKARKIIGLERFQEEPGLIGDIAKLFTADGEIKGSSKAAKAAKQETVDAYRKLLEG